MSPAEASIAAAPPDTVEVRIVRHRVRKPAPQALSEWVGNEILGGADGGTDGERPLRVSAIHWITSAGSTVPVDIPPDPEFAPRDVAILLTEAARRGVRCMVWSETNRIGGGSMQPGETWFAAADGGDGHPLVETRSTADGIVVSVDESIPPQRFWLLFYPVLLVTFAWVFFLVLGALPAMVRDIWQRSIRGTGQRFDATLDGRELRIEVERDGRVEPSVVIDRSALIAVGTTFGFVAYADGDAVALPSEFVTPDLTTQNEIRTAIAAAINQTLRAS